MSDTFVGQPIPDTSIIEHESIKDKYLQDSRQLEKATYTSIPSDLEINSINSLEELMILNPIKRKDDENLS